MRLQSVKSTAKRFNLSERRIQKLCEEGRIAGAQMISNVWLIPDSAEKPADERISASVDDMVSLPELCSKLSISVATGRNWVKLGKIVPAELIKRTYYFTNDYVEQLKSDIMTGNNTSLKSRRNKKYISGNNIYNSYVSEHSSNIRTVQSIIEKIEHGKIAISEDILIALIADCAIQLINAKTETAQKKCGLSDYVEGKNPNNPYMFLVDDLVSQNMAYHEILKQYPDLFQLQYKYEEKEDVLGLLYISLKNIGCRKATGSYYTPTKVVKKMCDRLISMNNCVNKSVFDPCCGTGNFILQLPKVFEYENVYGNDIDSMSIKIARINYALKYEVSDKATIYSHITEQDYLTSSESMKFDHIIGNPPWGYEFTEAQKNYLRGKYVSANGSNIESYDVFIEQALQNLAANGVLSFVLPEAFLYVKTHTPIRSLLIKENSIQYLEFLGNVFDKVQCPCIIMQSIHDYKPFNTMGLVINDGKKEYSIETKRSVNANCLSFSMTDEEYIVLNKIDGIEDKATLEGNSVFALGIVTGNNKKYISNQKKDGYEMVLKGSDIYKYRVQPSNNYIDFEPESFQQVAPVKYYRAEEKLLYRFICNHLVFAYDCKQTLSLNSCNILIPQVDTLDIKYILAILNSRPAQFFSQKKFNSVKILRSHIEQIPIPQIGLEEQARIIAQVDSLLEITNNRDINIKYDLLDAEIASLYMLTSAEYQVIRDSMEGENLFLF